MHYHLNPQIEQFGLEKSKRKNQTLCMPCTYLKNPEATEEESSPSESLQSYQLPLLQQS
jgi:hypothetical protein